MNTHELAEKLLDGPNVEIVTDADSATPTKIKYQWMHKVGILGYSWCQSQKDEPSPNCYNCGDSENNRKIYCRIF